MPTAAGRFSTAGCCSPIAGAPWRGPQRPLPVIVTGKGHGGPRGRDWLRSCGGNERDRPSEETLLAGHICARRRFTWLDKRLFPVQGSLECCQDSHRGIPWDLNSYCSSWGRLRAVTTRQMYHVSAGRFPSGWVPAAHSGSWGCFMRWRRRGRGGNGETWKRTEFLASRLQFRCNLQCHSAVCGVDVPPTVTW